MKPVILLVIIFLFFSCKEKKDDKLKFDLLYNKLQSKLGKEIKSLEEFNEKALIVKCYWGNKEVEAYFFDEKGELTEYVFFNAHTNENWKRIKFENASKVKDVWGKGIYLTGNFYDSNLTINDEFEARIYLARPIFGENHLEVQEIFNNDSMSVYISEKIDYINEPYVVADNQLTSGWHKQLYINTITSKYFEEPIIDTFIIDFYVRSIDEVK